MRLSRGRNWLALPAVALFLGATDAQASGGAEMTPERIAEAIALGSRTDIKLIRLSAGRAECFLATPFLRVAMAAAAAKREYRTFTPADVRPR